ncbi:hypothetical protein CUR85_08450 [Sulfitobacter faviae]|nr:esterase-like activity of phytase family protein [Sulfitobacter faviae]MDH4540263.1 hypothetical protein [Sulfitobacter faviae]
MQRRSERKLIRACLPFFLLIACVAPAAQTGPVVQVDSVLTWRHPAPWFGGFSGVEVNADGTRLTAVSDRGRVVQARMLREAGRLVALEIVEDAPLKDADGKPLRDKMRDAEALALDGSGQLYVSFEHDHHVARLSPESGVTTPLPRHDDFAKFEPNAGMETLAAHPDGRLFATPKAAARPRVISRSMPLTAAVGRSPQRSRAGGRSCRWMPILPRTARFTCWSGRSRRWGFAAASAALTSPRLRLAKRHC